LCEAVGTAIQPLGFEQLPPLQRYTKRSPKPAALFGLREADEDFAARRAALSRVLRVVNDIAPDAPVVLDLFVFGVRDEAVVLVRTAVSDVLGEPGADGDLMRWPDGFAIRFHEFPADALAEAMYGYTEPTSEERVHFPTKYKWVAEQRQRQETENAKRRQR